METINIKRTIPAPIDQVFELLSNHAGYSDFPGVKEAKLLQEGRSEPNGLGAIRRIGLGAVWFEEDITAFERPTRMDYRIKRSRPPIDHEGGSIQLRETDAGTEVTWTSTFRVKIPLLGRFLTPGAARMGEKAFGGMLKAVDKKLQQP